MVKKIFLTFLFIHMFNCDAVNWRVFGLCFIASVPGAVIGAGVGSSASVSFAPSFGTGILICSAIGCGINLICTIPPMWIMGCCDAACRSDNNRGTQKMNCIHTGCVSGSA